MALTLVKCGGAVLAKEPFVLERYVDPGSGGCVVHGAGTRISAALLEAGIESTFAGGRRVTTKEALPIIRLDLKQMLEENGMDVVGEARDGLEAVELARTTNPDVGLF
ncbi:MAG TPA: hypothetical protein VH210_12705, partial [Gaiellaceae bacterium]|nr:hypothetical protein [Gaiellaceae bacterium]